MSRTKITNSKGTSSIVSLTVGLGLTLLAFLVVINKQSILDLIAYYQYTPTSEVVSIARRTTMNDKGRFYFYASKPVIEKTQAFNKVCDRKEATSAILGCYTEDRLYVYDVSDKRLDGIKEVTAAHETLHAVYQRLGSGERAEIDKLLEAEYEKLKGNKDLTDRMGFYARNEKDQEDNELHSILGTEFANLSPELEAHYARYFTDRQAVVKLHETYASVFNDLQSKADNLSSQLKTLGDQIENASAKYNEDVKTLNADIDSFNKRAQAGSFTSRTAFNQERDALVARVTGLSTSRSSINTDIQTYETLRNQYNETASISNQLYKSIDSKLAPAPSV
jgi:hypothetical protein